MEIKKLNDTIYQMDYILCCLTAYRGIIETGRDCNKCAAVTACEYAPKPWERVRYNCPHFVEPKKVACDSITCMKEEKLHDTTTNDSEIPNTSADHIAEADKMEPFARGHENDKDTVYREDVIDKVVKAVRKIILDPAPVDFKMSTEYAYLNIYNVINGLPSAQPKSKRGKWLNKDTRNDLYECSECGQVIYSESHHDLRESHAYCSRCGAYMGGDAHA